METVPGLRYSPNKLDGIEITPIVSLEPVGIYLSAGKVDDK
jgi:hypothetical protein